MKNTRFCSIANSLWDKCQYTLAFIYSHVTLQVMFCRLYPCDHKFVCVHFVLYGVRVFNYNWTVVFKCPSFDQFWLDCCQILSCTSFRYIQIFHINFSIVPYSRFTCTTVIVFLRSYMLMVIEFAEHWCSRPSLWIHTLMDYIWIWIYIALYKKHKLNHNIKKP